MSVNSKMTALADEIRELSGTDSAMGLDAMTNHVGDANIEVDSQTNLIAQIQNALEGKAGGSTDHSVEDAFVVKSLNGYYENNRVTKVGNYAFANCSNLTMVNIPNAEDIRSNAFQYCSNLTTVIFPVCSSIGQNAFLNCSNLTTASFGTPQYIMSDAFRECFRLSSVTFNAWVCPYMYFSDIFTSTPYAGYSSYFSGTPYIYVPASLVSSFKTATNWTYFSSYFRAIPGTEV